MTISTTISDMEREANEVAKVFANADEMHKLAPALFATSAHPKMTDRYSFTNTYDILLHMHNRGFRVSSIQGGLTPYSKVLVRLRPQAYTQSDYAPELILVDSHDGSSRLKLFLGFITFLCMNGCIAGDMLYGKSFVHLSPELMAEIMLELDDVEQHVGKLHSRLAAMKAYKTTEVERMMLADTATRIRFGGERSRSFIADIRQKLLKPRRPADENDHSMYTTYNIVQENAIRGGMNYMSNNRLLRMRDVRSVNANMSINQMLWKTAEELMQREAA
jgi:hypothetical protein